MVKINNMRYLLEAFLEMVDLCREVVGGGHNKIRNAANLSEVFA